MGLSYATRGGSDGRQSFAAPGDGGGRPWRGRIVGAFQAVTTGALASTPKYGLANVGAFGGEPTIASNLKGELYDTTPSGGTILYRSTNHGSTWTKATTADPSSGDDCITTDQSGALYECNLAGSQSTAPLQADVWKSVDDGKTWTYGNNVLDSDVGANVCGTSCQPFGVDRQWTDAYIPPGKTTTNAIVALGYHDFYGPVSIWVNVSTDGGKTYGPSTNVLANFTQNGADQAAVAEADSACNTVPTGLRIEKNGPHPGRIYISWIASDPESPATGCNVTMVQSFHNMFVAWSDDHGATWTPQLAYDAGIGHDASTPFATFTLDTRGNPYIGFAAPGPSDNPAVCAAESTASTVQSDPTCDYHMWVVWSPDGGSTWDGGGGAIPGSAASAYEVDPSSKPQTDVFPTIAAGPAWQGGCQLAAEQRDRTDRPAGQVRSGRLRRAGTRQRQPHVLSPAVQMEPPRGPIAQPDRLTAQGGMGNAGAHHNAHACRRHLQPGDLLRVARLEPEPARLQLRDGRPHDRVRAHRLRRRHKVNKLRAANQVSGPNILK